MRDPSESRTGDPSVFEDDPATVDLRGVRGREDWWRDQTAGFFQREERLHVAERVERWHPRKPELSIAIGTVSGVRWITRAAGAVHLFGRAIQDGRCRAGYQHARRSQPPES